MQPTSPFRTKKLIYRAIKIFKSNKSLPVVGVSKIKKNSTIKNKIIFSYDKESKKYRRFKKSKNIFFVNGSVYLVSKMYFKENKHIYKNIISPVISNNIKESLDINTYRDFEKARSLID